MSPPQAAGAVPPPLQDETVEEVGMTSDGEDDPGKLLNAWLGELDSLKKVST